MALLAIFLILLVEVTAPRSRSCMGAGKINNGLMQKNIVKMECGHFLPPDCVPSVYICWCGVGGGR